MINTANEANVDVARLIKHGQNNGAYVRDIGFEVNHSITQSQREIIASCVDFICDTCTMHEIHSRL